MPDQHRWNGLANILNQFALNKTTEMTPCRSPFDPDDTASDDSDNDNSDNNDDN